MNEKELKDRIGIFILDATDKADRLPSGSSERKNEMELVLKAYQVLNDAEKAEMDYDIELKKISSNEESKEIEAKVEAKSRLRDFIGKIAVPVVTTGCMILMAVLEPKGIFIKKPMPIQKF